jgi:3-oxoacyl-[acyl-carrier-protein] synthase-3
MKSINKTRILSSGIYLPNSISSHEIETKYNIPLGYSERYSGVKSRHQISFESNGYMGARALENALSNANIRLTDLDAIIAAGATFDYVIPNQSSVILSELEGGSSCHISTFDINTTCLSFLSALEIASKLLESRQYKKLAIVSSEIASKGLNQKNNETFTLFGDGAAAFILEYNEMSDSTFYKSSFKTYTSGLKATIIRGGGNAYHFKDYPYDTDLYSFNMNGFELLKLAKKLLPDFVKSFLSESDINDLEIIVPHQASKIGLEFFKKLYPFSDKQIMENIETHGNCISASIPILFHQSIESGEIKRGNNCFLIGTSAGFSIGAVYLKY